MSGGIKTNASHNSLLRVLSPTLAASATQEILGGLIHFPYLLESHKGTKNKNPWILGHNAKLWGYKETFFHSTNSVLAPHSLLQWSCPCLSEAPPPSSSVSCSAFFHVIPACLSFSLCSDLCFPASCSCLLARRTVKVEVFSCSQLIYLGCQQEELQGCLAKPQCPSLSHMALLQQESLANVAANLWQTCAENLQFDVCYLQSLANSADI